MADRLARAIQHVNELPEAVQEEIALHIEELLLPHLLKRIPFVISLAFGKTCKEMTNLLPSTVCGINSNIAK